MFWYIPEEEEEELVKCKLQDKNQNIFWHKKSVKLKWSVLSIMVHTNVDLFIIILLSYKYYIIFSPLHISNVSYHTVNIFKNCLEIIKILKTLRLHFFQGQGL